MIMICSDETVIAARAAAYHQASFLRLAAQVSNRERDITRPVRVVRLLDMLPIPVVVSHLE
jgi:hypothetical protein